MRNLTRTAVLLGVIAAGTAWSVARGSDSGDATNSTAFTDLGSTDSDTRTSAIASLVTASSTSLSDLQNALEQEPSLLVKAGIAEAIVRREPTTSQVTQLATSLLAADAPTRLEVARLLGRTHPSTARSALTLAAENAKESPEVRAAAAVSLGRAGSDARLSLSALASTADLPIAVRRAALRGLALTGSDGVEAVVAIATASGTPVDRRDAAIAALGDADAPSGDALVTLLGASNEAIRARAVEAVVARGAKTSAVAGALADRLADASAAIRRAAVEALVSLEGASSKKTEMLGLLSDSEESVQIATIQALARAFAGGDSTVADALAALVDHDHFVIRYHAAVALGALKDTRGLSAMQTHRSTETDDEKAAADDAAAQIVANTN